jgi:hypothetical protein
MGEYYDYFAFLCVDHVIGSQVFDIFSGYHSVLLLDLNHIEIVVLG